MLLVLSSLLHTAYDWRGAITVAVAVGDVKAAFDNCSLVTVARAMHECGVPGHIIAAFLRTQLNLKLKPFFERLEVKESPFEGMLRQGGKEGPYCWNLNETHLSYVA